MPGKDDSLIEGLTAEVRRVGDLLELKSAAISEPRHRDLKMPRRMNWLTFARAAPGIFSEWDGLKPVPEEFINTDADDDGRPLAVVACPCGETPAIGLAQSETCNCRRVFVNIGHSEVRAYRPPPPPPMTDEEYAPD